MKKILAFLALASLAQVALAVDYSAVNEVASGAVISNPAVTGAANTCPILSAAEPPVTINLSRDVLAALLCNATANAAGAATQHPAGRPAACNSARCGYMATTSGGPVNAFNAGATVPATGSLGSVITGCATYIAGHTSGSVSAACQ